eukprot:351280-Chlamydomonas_euryale.AAC.10
MAFQAEVVCMEDAAACPPNAMRAMKSVQVCDLTPSWCVATAAPVSSAVLFLGSFCHGGDVHACRVWPDRELVNVFLEALILLGRFKHGCYGRLLNRSCRLCESVAVTRADCDALVRGRYACARSVTLEW